MNTSDSALMRQEFKFNGDIFTKVYDKRTDTYQFFHNDEPIDIYQWNQAVNRYQPMSHKSTHPNVIIRLIERQRWRLTRRHIHADQSSAVVDIGCESGNISASLVSSCRRVVLMDVDEGVLRTIHNRWKGRSVTCLAGDVYKIPFASGSIDRIICTEVLEHLVRPQEALSEIERVLKRGGKALISIPNDHLILWVKRKLIRAGLSKALGNLSPGLPMGHLHVFSKESLASLLGPRLKLRKCFYNFPWFTNLFFVVEKR